MEIVAVDDERIMLEGLVKCIKNVEPEAEVHAFISPRECLVYAQDHEIDVAFVDIRMPGIGGLELGRRLLEINPLMNLIYCTAYEEYVWEAFRSVRCNGYITKPVEEKQVREELMHLRAPLTTKKEGLQIQCFGRFEVFFDGKPVEFENAKTKELLAFLVNQGGSICRNQEIIAYLWDDDYRHDSYFKKIRNDMLQTLSRLGYEDIIWRQRGGLGIDMDKVQCDFYEWKKTHFRKYTGDYMIQYEWANIPEYE